MVEALYLPLSAHSPRTPTTSSGTFQGWQDLLRGIFMSFPMDLFSSPSQLFLSVVPSP